MKIKEYFDIFFKDTGITKKWFAEKIGMDANFFYQVAAGNYPLPKKYWTAVIDVSLGKISLANLIEDYLDADDLLQVDYLKNDKCVVSLRKINKTKNDEEKN